MTITRSISFLSISSFAITDAQMVFPAPGAALTRKCRSPPLPSSQESAFFVASACQGRSLISGIFLSLLQIAGRTQRLAIRCYSHAAIYPCLFVISVKACCERHSTFLTHVSGDDLQNFSLSPVEESAHRLIQYSVMMISRKGSWAGGSHFVISLMRRNILAMET